MVIKTRIINLAVATISSRTLQGAACSAHYYGSVCKIFAAMVSESQRGPHSLVLHIYGGMKALKR